ncbi:MHO_4530 family protein [Mycoplasma struthionis]|uniref:EAL domain-containing protein n=1 Tax=Mycoplasma struthionis TaxID=538220 RepID=A0A3G8LIM9_9MOLU|nr:hypothetical protein [Mycoplasma struthionis]AZG68518.1 hypothetical protein EGN60_00825 [Mycoplasma struthionis]
MNSIFIAFILIFVLATFVTLTILIVYATKKRLTFIQRSTGFFVFKVDTKQKRIKFEEIENVTQYVPSFLKINGFDKGEWISIDDFEHLFSEEVKKEFHYLINKRETKTIDTSFQWGNKNQFYADAKIEITNFNESDVWGTFYWNTHKLNEKIVFNKFGENIDQMLNINENYEVVGFILKTQNINQIDNFIKLFKEGAALKNIHGVDAYIHLNKLFFVLKYKQFNLAKRRKILSYFAKASKNYFKFFSTIFNLEKKDINNYKILDLEILCDYIKLLNNTEEIIYAEDILKTENFKIFKEKYLKVTKELDSRIQYVPKSVKLRALNNNKTNITLLFKKDIFEEFNIEDKSLISSLDLYIKAQNLFYKKISEDTLEKTFYTIDDYIFNYIDFKIINKIAQTSPSFINNIRFNIFKSINRIEKKVLENKVKEKNLLFGLEINKIDDRIISIIKPWINFVFISKELSKQLNKPDIILFIQTLIEKVNALGIKIVFENFDYKNYRKILNKHPKNIYYIEE